MGCQVVVWEVGDLVRGRVLKSRTRQGRGLEGEIERDAGKKVQQSYRKNRVWMDRVGAAEIDKTIIDMRRGFDLTWLGLGLGFICFVLYKLYLFFNIVYCFF